jgi:hypothetical protein
MHTVKIPPALAGSWRQNLSLCAGGRKEAIHVEMLRLLVDVRNRQRTAAAEKARIISNCSEK